MTKVVVKQDAEKEVTVEILAANIIAISNGVQKLRRGPLNEKALVLLIQHAAPSVGGRYKASPLSAKQIKAVLDGIENLEAEYIRKGRA